MEMIKGKSSCYMSTNGVKIKFKAKEWLGTKMSIKNADHNASNKHENKGVGHTGTIKHVIRESASSSGGKTSVLLRKVLDTEEGIGDKMHLSTSMLVNNMLEEKYKE